MKESSMKIRSVVLLAGLACLASTRADAQGADPCALISATELQQAFPGIKPGRLDRGLEKQGILRCEWILPVGRMVLISGGDDESDTPVDEAETMMMAFVDPLHADAQRNVRIEKLPGVGDEAVAVVERMDKAKGITQNGALLVVRRGKRQIVVMTDDLARRERAEALKVLSDLGKAIAKRLG
jgi:hypothetical protein